MAGGGVAPSRTSRGVTAATRRRAAGDSEGRDSPIAIAGADRRRAADPAAGGEDRSREGCVGHVGRRPGKVGRRSATNTRLPQSDVGSPQSASRQVAASAPIGRAILPLPGRQQAGPGGADGSGRARPRPRRPPRPRAPGWGSRRVAASRGLGPASHAPSASSSTASAAAGPAASQIVQGPVRSTTCSSVRPAHSGASPSALAP